MSLSSPDDDNTPFAFSMEGDQNIVPGPLVPRFWYPGWNSEQSINKFQIEIGGPLHGGNPGKRLIEPSNAQAGPLEIGEIPAPSKDQIWFVPTPRIFGSEELSRLAPGIASLIPEVVVSIHPDLAA